MPKTFREIGTGVIFHWMLGGLGLIVIAAVSYTSAQAAKVPALEQKIEDCRSNHLIQASKNDELIRILSDTREDVASIKGTVNQLNKSIERIYAVRGR